MNKPELFSLTENDNISRYTVFLGSLCEGNLAPLMELCSEWVRVYSMIWGYNNGFTLRKQFHVFFCGYKLYLY